MTKFQFFFFLTCVLAAIIAANDAASPQRHDFAMSAPHDPAGSSGPLPNGPLLGAGGGSPFPPQPAPPGGVSRVTITVGDTAPNGEKFVYPVYGYTESPFRIFLSGDYYNNAYTKSGYVNLFLGVQNGIDYYWVQPQQDNTIEVDIRNVNGAMFYFQIIPPQGVNAFRDLWGRQFNATTLLMTAPSRSQIWG